MKKLGIGAHKKRKFKATIDSEHDLPIAQNILARNFSTTEPDQAWVADMTYIWTTEGWLYLAVIIDLFSRRVVGWSMAEHMPTELVLTALEAALGQRVPSQTGLVFHSDRGRQYASRDYQNALLKADITCSPSRRANCWDHAVAETFFCSLKTELIYPMIVSTQAIARTINGSLTDLPPLFRAKVSGRSPNGVDSLNPSQNVNWSFASHSLIRTSKL